MSLKENYISSILESTNAENRNKNEVEIRSPSPYQNDLPLAAEDVPWDWDTTAADEVLGKGLDNWDRYKQAHLWFDPEKTESKAGYKLPFARMINGELRIVLRGIYAAMAAINGARGGVDIPDSDREKIYANLVKYYKRFEKEAPPLRNVSETSNSNHVVLKSVELAGEKTNIHNIRLGEKRRFSYNIGSFKIDEKSERSDKTSSFIVVKGIASSTSVDHYGTEMSYRALKEMEAQVKKGIVILPRHESLTGSGLAEWDEVIGRTFNGSVKSSSVIKPGAPNLRGFVLEVESKLYGDDERTKNLIKRLKRGEPIGQSIGGWFEEVKVEERSDGEIERIIVENVTLDHIAITRAPANPDSHGLNVLDIRSSIKSFLNRRKSMDNQEVIEQNKTVQKQEAKDVTKRGIDVNPPLPVNSEPVKETSEPSTAEAGKEGVMEGDERLDENSMEMKTKMEKMERDYDELKAKYEALIEALKEENEKKKDSEDKEEKEDHDKGAIKDDEDHIEALEEDKKEDEADLSEEERVMKEKERMKEYMKEFMKEYAQTLSSLNQQQNDSSLLIEQNTAQKLDNLSNLNNSNSDNNIPKGEDMSPEDIAKIVTQVTRSILAEQNKSEESKTEDRKTEDRTKLEAAYGASEPSMEELKARLERAENTLNRVLEMPLRKGRHTSTQVRGIGSETQMDNMIQEVEREGHQSLASVVKRYRTHIMRSADKTVTDTLNSHELKDVLAKGLRAAYLDGLLGTPVDGWQ